MGRKDVMIDELDEGQWALLAVLRIAAIRNSPGAFRLGVGEEQRGEAEWRAQFEHRSWWVAYASGEPVGIVSSVEDGHHRYVESMWVKPAYRGHGIATDLLRAVERLARREGHGGLRLRLLEGNPKAERFYLRLGFERLAPGEYRLQLPTLTAGEAVAVPAFLGR